MKLDKVIELLSIEAEVKLRTGEIDLRNAIRVSIEAVKKVQHLHKIQVLQRDELLSGETDGYKD